MRINVVSADGSGSACATRLRKGETVIINGRRFTVGSRQGRVRFFMAADDPEFVVDYTLGAIDQMADRKTLVCASRGHDLPDFVKVALRRAVESYPPEDVAYMHRALRYCMEVDRGGRSKALTKRGLAAPIEKVATETSDPNPISWSQLRKWFLRWIAAGRDCRSLLPGTRNRGNRNRVHGHWLHELALDFLGRKWLFTDKTKITKLQDAFVNEVRQKAADLGVAEPQVGKNFLYRKVEEFEEYTKLSHRHSKKLAEHEVRNVGRGPQGSYAGETYEIDHTPLDLIAYCPRTGTVLGRPYLTLVIDRYSRLCVGFVITFLPPGWTSVMLALRLAIQPKDEWMAQFAGIEGTWACRGAPGGFGNDRGREFQSAALDELVLRVGATPVDLPPGRPQTKGKVESFIDSLQQETIHQLEGSTGRNPTERGDYPASKRAKLSIQAINWIVTKWLVDDYHVRPHPMTMEAPQARWDRSVAEVGSRPSVDPQVLTAFLGKAEHCCADRRGIRLNHLFYNSKELAQIRNVHAKLGAKTGRKAVKLHLDVTLDPMDLGAVDVLDPGTNSWIKVPCTWPEYAKGLTLHQHREIRRHTLAQSNGPVTRERLHRARVAHHEAIQALCADGATATQPKRLARFMETGPRGADVIEADRYDPHASGRTITQGGAPGTTKAPSRVVVHERFGPGSRAEVLEAAPTALPEAGGRLALPRPASSEPAAPEPPEARTPPEHRLPAPRPRPEEDEEDSSLARQSRAKAFVNLDDL